MKKYIKTSLLLCFPLLLSAQLKLNNNGVIIKVSTGTDLRVNNGSIENQNAGSIDNNGNIYLDATFNQVTGASYTAGASSWLWFEGAGTQNASSDAAMNIPRLRVDNGNRLVLGNNINVSTNVDLMNNGNIELGNFNLNVATGGTINNYDASNFIITNGTGRLQHLMVPGDVFYYPVGNSAYNPVQLSSMGGVNEEFSVGVTDVVYDKGTSGTPETQGVVNRSWHITEGTTGGNLMDILVEWDQSQELASFDRSQSGIAHWDGTAWEHPTIFTAATNMGGTRWSQSKSGQTTFSPFAVEDIEVDLPIELLSFDAKRINANQVNLDWATASETNNKGFYVERMLEVENVFEAIAFVDGKGTTTATSYYELQDQNSYTGVSYYRLRQVDFDGTTSYSDIRAVSGRAGENGATAVDVYPNPVKENLTIRFNELAKEVTAATLKIMSVDGKVLYQFNQKITAFQQVHIDVVKTFPSAVYLIEISLNNGERVTQKFVKE